MFEKLPHVQLRKLSLSHTEIYIPISYYCELLPASLTPIALRDANISGLQLDGYPSLTHLEILECLNTAPVIEDFSRPALKCFKFSEACFKTRDGKILSNMLDRFEGLEQLQIGFWVAWDYKEVGLLASTIAKHQKTLKNFAFDYCDTEPDQGEVDSSNDDLIDAAGQCRSLAQLGLFCFRRSLLPSIKVRSVLKTTDFLLYFTYIM